MTEGFFAIIIAIVGFLVYDNIAKNKSAGGSSRGKQKSVAETAKARTAQASAKPKRASSSAAKSKRGRAKKTAN